MEEIQSIYIGNGKFIQSTSNHQFLTEFGYKELKDLSPEEISNIKRREENDYEKI
jgi:cell wall-associated NlpC family hydrolase